MRFENHPLLNAIIANRRSRVCRREDGIIEIAAYRSPFGDDERSFGVRARAPSQSAPLPTVRKRWWRSIASAMRSVPAQMLDAFVEGCFLYAVSMNPGAFGFSIQDAELDDPPEDSIPPRSTPVQTDAPHACPEIARDPRSKFMK
jgi:hypothetical protein